MTAEGLEIIKTEYEDIVRQLAEQSRQPSFRRFEHDGRCYEVRAFFDADSETKVETREVDAGDCE